MNTTYAQRQTTAQKKDAPSASSIFDASSQSESLQRKADLANSTAQREEPPRPNNTGMPDDLKAGIESLSGFSMDDVRVHYNSSKPATVQALAYTQGTDIHVAPGQEKHLPHEAWHVAQQMAGRVSPTTNINGMPVNDNAALEHEADVMGEKAVQRVSEMDVSNKKINYNFGNTCQMLRVINAYEFFDGIMQGSTNLDYNGENSTYLFSHTERLRKKYKERAGILWDKYCMSGKFDDLKKLKPYAPITFETKKPEDLELIEWNDIESEINDRIDEKFDFVSAQNATKVHKYENLVINAHGEQGSFFASYSPSRLAKKVNAILPKGYAGEIYLAGCHTGERDLAAKGGFKEGSSYIEIFYKCLKDRRVNDDCFSPQIKGNKNVSISMNDGVYVSADARRGISGNASHRYTATNGKEYYKGKKTKLHIDENGNVY